MIKPLTLGILLTALTVPFVLPFNHAVPRNIGTDQVNVGKSTADKDLLAALKSAKSEVTAQQLTKDGKIALPIMEKTVFISVPESFTGPDNFVWDSLVDILYNLTEQKDVHFNIILNVQGFGGDVFTLNKVVNMIMFVRSKNVSVIMRVVGPSYSAHALLTCSTPDVIITPTGSLMYHSAAAYKTLLGLSVYRDTNINEMQIDNMANEIYKLCILNKRLNSASVDFIKAGKEVIQVPEGKFIVTRITEDRMNFASAVYEAIENLGILAVIFVSYLLAIYVVIRVSRKAWKA